MPTSSVLGQLRGKIVDGEGRLAPEAQRVFYDAFSRVMTAIDRTNALITSIAAAAKIQGRTEGIGTTVQNLNTDGTVNSLDNVHDGATYGRPIQAALTAGSVDLGKVGVVGQAGSAKLSPNVMLNYSNNATVDSIDNGVNATVRVYGPAGVGTTWHQIIGATNSAEYPAFSGTAAYDTDFYVIYDGTQFVVTATPSDSLPDGLKFCAFIHTVQAGGAGGTGGGGGAGGGGNGRNLK